MFLKQRPGRLFAATLVACLTLTGCQANPKPAPLPSPEPAPSASPTPTAAAAPTLPPEARGTSMASAKAFVRHWIETLNYVGPRGESALLEDLNSPDCKACAAITDFIREVSSAGGSIRGQGWDIESLRLVYTNKSRTVIDALVMVHPQRVKASRSAQIQRFDGGRRLKTFWLSHHASGWRVTSLDQPQ